VGTDDWATPEEVCCRLDEFWGGPADLDPCSNGRSIVRSRKRYTAGGLHLPWRKSTFENNPYSKMLPWVEKGARELACGNTNELVTLWPVAPSTVWWKRAVGREPIPAEIKGGKEIEIGNPSLVFPKRLAFIDEKGKPVPGNRFDSVLFFYGKSEKRHTQFRRVFGDITNWCTRGR
jgi:hypothetical protein